MSIDLGNSPVGTPPTPTEKTQLRTSLGLGTTDSVAFGTIDAEALIFETVTETEALAIPRDVGSFLVSSDTKRSFFWGASNTPLYITGGDKLTYYVNPSTGNDTYGLAGSVAFKTFGAAIDAAIADYPSGNIQVAIEFQAGIYNTADSTNPQTYTANTASTINFSLKMNAGVYIILSSATFLNNSSGNLFIEEITGSPLNSGLKGTMYHGGSGSDEKELVINIPVFPIVSLGTSPIPPLVIVTGGNVRLNLGRFKYTSALTSGLYPSIIEVQSGSVTVVGFKLIASSSFLAKGNVVKVASGASARLINCTAQNYGLAIQDATDSQVTLENCVHYSGRSSDTIVTATAALTDLTILWGSASNRSLGANTNEVTTFGTLTVADTSNLI
tara:strand:- start:1417 stop:2574 length:1158 start_codon:yes stop_codon:yes gene_type:complete